MAAARPAASSSPPTPDEAVARATDILGMDIKGHTVHKVMIAELSPEIEAEYYVSYLLDRTNRTFLAMASVQGGMDIEEVAEKTPEALAKVPVNAVEGVNIEKAREIVAQAKFPAEVAERCRRGLVTLWDTFVAEDALLVEVNPLVKTKDGRQSWRWTARSRSTRTPSSASRSTRRSRTRTRPTRSRPPPRRRTSTTSSSTARSASSATARVSS